MSNVIRVVAKLSESFDMETPISIFIVDSG